MPKVKLSLRNKISFWISPNNKSKEIFSTDGKIIYCLCTTKSFHQKKNIF